MSATLLSFSATDLLTAGIVLGGTLLATVLRCGFGACGAAAAALGLLVRRPFDADAVRAALAGQLQQIRRDGLLRAEPRPMADAEFDAATDALIANRSIDALIATHERHKATRARLTAAAAETFWQAADLAPVFGLAGTLVSLSRLPADGIDRSAYLVAIGMAVHATLYGLLAANLLLAPLARLVERRAAEEEQDRQAVIDWLARQLALAAPPPRFVAGHGAGRHVAHTGEAA